MATLAHDRNGTKRILVTLNGRRKPIRIGRVNVKDAEAFMLRVRDLESAYNSATSINPALCEWLNHLPDTIHDRISRLGLAPQRVRVEAATLKTLLDRFAQTISVKASTRAAYKQAMESLRKHFEDAKPLAAITPVDAAEWRKAMVDSGLAGATVAKRIHVAKAIFRKAVRWKMLSESPFADVRPGSQANPDRSFHVPAEWMPAILDACPDDQWRAIVSLSRYAGLRCPSEMLLLRWGDVNWDRGRMTVRSPKTANHEGHAARIVPIVPEVRAILLRLFESAAPGTEAVIPRLRDPKVNLRTTFRKVIGRAGYSPWPRLFHNLRASCASDLAERFPAHVVAGWLGHSPLIAAKHYLTTRDAHFDLAAGIGSGERTKSGATSAQKAAQHTAASDRTGSKESLEVPRNAQDMQRHAIGCEAVHAQGMGAGGFEPPKALAIRFTV